MNSKYLEKELLLEIAVFLIGLGSISLFYTNNLLILVLAAAPAIIGMRFWYKKNDIYLFLTGAVIGPSAEIVCIHFGVWSYANPTAAGIPLWLPVAWGVAVVLIKRIHDTLTKLLKLS